MYITHFDCVVIENYDEEWKSNVLIDWFIVNDLTYVPLENSSSTCNTVIEGISVFSPQNSKLTCNIFGNNRPTNNCVCFID